jgi:hypothetical protein
MFGGGIHAKRRYSRPASGDDSEPSVEISITADSPMMQGMLMAMNNPAMLGAGGGKMERIGGERAVVKYDGEGKSGEITIVVANRYLVQVSGSAVSAQDLKSYASGVDYKKLAALP